MIVAYVLIGRPLSVVWNAWQDSGSFHHWMIPGQQWKCVQVENDPEVGGRYYVRLEDGSGTVQTYSGKYTALVPFESLSFVEDDGASGVIEFQQIDNNTIVRKTCEPVWPAPGNEWRPGCQAMLDRFKKFVEENGRNY